MKLDISFMVLLGVTLTRLESVVMFPLGVEALVILGLTLGLFRGLGTGFGLELLERFLLFSPGSCKNLEMLDGKIRNLQNNDFMTIHNQILSYKTNHGIQTLPGFLVSIVSVK